MNTRNTFWKAARFPLFGFTILLTLYGAWALLDLPPKEDLIKITEEYFALYGYVIVFIAAFFEALLVVGWYFPGGVVIFLAIILSPSPAEATFAVLIVTLGLYSGYIVNFFLGKYGWYRLLLAFGIQRQLEEAQTKLSRRGATTIFLTYWNPGLAAIIATAAGVIQYPVFRFLMYSFIAVTIWDIFWGILVYALGKQSLEIVFSLPFILAIITIWFVVRYVGEYKNKSKLK